MNDDTLRSREGREGHSGVGQFFYIEISIWRENCYVTIINSFWHGCYTITLSCKVINCFKIHLYSLTWIGSKIHFKLKTSQYAISIVHISGSLLFSQCLYVKKMIIQLGGYVGISWIWIWKKKFFDITLLAYIRCGIREGLKIFLRIPPLFFCTHQKNIFMNCLKRTIWEIVQ